MSGRLSFHRPRIVKTELILDGTMIDFRFIVLSPVATVHILLQPVSSVIIQVGFT